MYVKKFSSKLWCIFLSIIDIYLNLKGSRKSLNKIYCERRVLFEITNLIITLVNFDFLVIPNLSIKSMKAINAVINAYYDECLLMHTISLKQFTTYWN